VTTADPPVALLSSEADLSSATQALIEVEPRFGGAVKAAGAPELRAREDGFWALVKSVVSQQLSVQAAATIAGRLETAGLTTPAAVLAATDADLRSLGLSRQKVRYVRGIASANLDYAALRSRPTAQVVETLTALPGIGRWTAEIYCMFALLHADAFAAGDLALQEGARMLFELDGRPTERELRVRSGAWSPYRGVAARILWRHYGFMKQRAATPSP
jgi:DNA-3-methyladenine glycosylase II